MSLSYLLLEKLDWPYFLNILASFCRTQPAREACLNLSLDLNQDEILKSWDDTIALKQILDLGYTPPISNLDSMDKLFQDINIGKILSIKDFCDLRSLAYGAKYLLKFCSDFEDKSYVLKRFKSVCYNFQDLIIRIEKVIDIKNNEVRSDASSELVRIRNEKFSLIRKIEFSLKSFFSNPQTSKYLQDSFYTVRSDRYVLPFKLDANGRIPGSVYDTSDSGQTLYIEPSSISPLNEKLLNLKVQERVEILKILKDLSGFVFKQKEELIVSYREIIDLDILTSKAIMAYILDAGTVNISKTSGIDLIDAKHPLLMLNDFFDSASPLDESSMISSKDKNTKTNKNNYQNQNQNQNQDQDQDQDKNKIQDLLKSSDISDLKFKVKASVVPNSISLGSDQTSLIISGPNAGGKTATLKLIAFLHLMLKAGLLIPAKSNSSMYLFSSIFIELGDLQSIKSNLSTFSAHIYGLKPILESATKNDLVLLDELCSGTDPQTGSALGQAIIEHLCKMKVISIVTTHFDKLKSLAITNPAVRNGSMSFSLQDNLPTYKLILDIPGQSYGIEIAQKIGLDSEVIQRAAELKGSDSEFNQLLDELLAQKEKTIQTQMELEEKIKQVDIQTLALKKQEQDFKEEKNRTLLELKDGFEIEISKIQDEYQQKLKLLKSTLDKLESTQTRAREDSLGLGLVQDTNLDSFKTTLKDLGNESKRISKNISSNIEETPIGKTVSFDSLEVGDTVYVKHLKKQGQIVSINTKEYILVKISNLNIQVSIKDITLIKKSQSQKASLKTSDTSSKNSVQNQSQNKNKNTKSFESKPLDLVLKTSSNCLDLRGIRQDELIDKLALFLDRSLTHGETDLVIIHGNGTDALKKATRKYLSSTKEYNLSFRPGSKEEGGDGVTIVHLK